MFFLLAFLLTANPAIAAQKIFCAPLTTGINHACARDLRSDRICSYPKYAFVSGSCIYDTNFVHIPEFKQKTQTVKITDAMIKKYGVNSVAENLIYRFYKSQEQPYFEQIDYEVPLFSYYKDLDLQIAFDFNNLEKIAKNGFLNQHQTNSSNGSLDQDYRKRIEEDMLNFSAPSSSLVYGVLPKYSFAPLTQPLCGLQGHEYATQYGNVIAVLKNEVKKRATFTVSDSLSLEYGSKPNTANHSFYWLKLPNKGSYSRYWEGQIWGKLTFQDIQYLLVNCYYPNELNASDISKLKKLTGLNVFQCKNDSNDPDHIHYAPDLNPISTRIRKWVNTILHQNIDKGDQDETDK